MLLWVGLFPGHMPAPDMFPTPSTSQADLSPIFIVGSLSLLFGSPGRFFFSRCLQEVVPGPYPTVPSAPSGKAPGLPPFLNCPFFTWLWGTFTGMILSFTSLFTKDAF